MKTLALVESPAQLLNVLEWSHQTGADLDQQTTVVLAPANRVSRTQLRRTAELGTATGHRIRWVEPRQDAVAAVRSVASLATELRGVDRLVVGDPFSGVIQVLLSVLGPREVVMVDDGTATIEFARLWAAGEDLVRWHSSPLGGPRRRIAALVRRRIGTGSGCRISLFTAMPVEPGGLPQLRNDFSWVRSLCPPPRVKDTSDLIGTSLVETGVVDRAHYLQGVSTLARTHSVDRYFAHRLERDDKLAEIARLGLRVVRPDLPLELVARREPIGQTLISFPSTVVHTLPLVLQDTASRLLVCGIADDWYTQQAPQSSDRFLGQVATSARDAHGLLSVAC